MSLQPFLIANTRIGLERDLEPWLLPEDAYPDIEDAYLWRGRVLRRLGNRFLARLERQLTAVDAGMSSTPTWSFDIFTPAGITETNPQIVPGSFVLTIGVTTITDNGDGTLTGAGGITGTINYITGIISLAGLPAAAASTFDVNYFPGLPVMGLVTREITYTNPLVVNQEQTVGFDTKYAYKYDSSTNTFIDITFYPSSIPFTWHGTDYEFFWIANYQSAMFATNNNPGLDAMAYDTLTAGATTTITVAGDATSLFVAGDVVFISPDSGSTTVFTSSTLPQGGAGVGSSIFGGVNTVIVVNVASTNNSGTGVILNLTRQIGNVASLGPIVTTVGDGIKWLDQAADQWSNFQPPLNMNGTIRYLQGALMIMPYKGRLVMLNTVEGPKAGPASNFAQRARWSQVGTVYYQNIPINYQGGANANAWWDDVPGHGGYIDATTLEQIISCEFIKDTLVVYFERSTWQLRYTGNELLPFIWEKINTELGANSTFSVVPFDRQTIAIGNVGIHACDSVNVQRIDQKIPDEVFLIQQLNNGSERVYGIRDYERELVYWTLPYVGGQTTGTTTTFPNKVLVWNYVNGAFSFFNDSFTCYGYIQPNSNQTWENTETTWEETFENWVNFQFQAENPPVAGGNQVGFVVLVQEDTTNEQTLYITAITPVGGITTITAPSHNLVPTVPIDGQYIKILSAGGITNNLVGKTFAVATVIDADNFTILTPDAPVGTFNGDGTIAIVNNMSILTKRFNPFSNEGIQTRLGIIDFYVNRTDFGQFTLNIYADDDSSIPINLDFAATISNITANITNITVANPAVITIDAIGSIVVGDVLWVQNVVGMGDINDIAVVVISINTATKEITTDTDSSGFIAYTGGGQVYDLSQSDLNVVNTFPESTLNASDDISLSNSKLWKRINPYFTAQMYQLQFTFSDVQMRSDPIIDSDFELHGLLAYFSKAGRIINI